LVRDKKLEQLWDGVSVNEDLPLSCLSQSTIFALLLHHSWRLRAPKLALPTALILVRYPCENVRLPKLAAQLPGNVLQRSKLKQLHRFIRNVRLPEDVLAWFVLSFTDSTQRLRLVIDRINWRLGRTEIAMGL